MMRRPSWGIDALLVLMVVIWGVNYSVIKRCFAEIPPQPFNALRLVVGAGTFYLAIRAARQARESGGRLSSVFYTTAPLTTRDRIDLLWLGLVGHLAYQSCFAGGVGATSVSNAALIIGSTPVAKHVYQRATHAGTITRRPPKASAPQISQTEKSKA